MTWMIPSNIAALSGSAILALIFAVLYIQNRERHMGIWTLGWAFHSLRFAFALGQNLDWHPLEMPHLIQICVLLSGLLLLWGSIEMARSSLSKAWWAGGGAAAVWVLLGHFFNLPFFAQTLPLFTFFGLVSIRTGLVFLRSPDLGGAGKYLTGWGFIVWGLHRFDYPFLRPVEWAAPTGFLLAAVLSLLVGFGMLMVYFQKMQDSLARSEKRFRTLVENSTDGIFLLDLDSRIIDINPHACRSLGYTPAELLGMSLDNVVQDLTEVGLPRRENPRPPASPVSLEGLHRCKNGRTFPVEVRLSPVSDPQKGDVLIALARDISAQKAGEAQLREASRKFQAVFNQTFQLIGLLEPDGTLLEVNETALKTTDAPAETLYGRKFWETPWWSDLPRQRRKLRDAIGETARGKFVRTEISFQERTGQLRHADFSLKPVSNESGQVVLLIAEGRDITERKHAEEDLRQSEIRFRRLTQQFEALLDGIPDAITLISPEWEVIWANKGAENAFNMEVGEIAGRHCFELWHQRDTICESCLVTACFRTRKPQEALLTTRDGRIWGIKVFPIFNKDGRVTNALQLATEITEKLRLREEADRASRLASLGELAAGVAHEINNPNGLALMNLPVLIEAFADMEAALGACGEAQDDFAVAGLPYRRMREEIPEMLSEMREGATRIKGIVEDLKNFVRQAPHPHQECFDLNQTVRTAVRLVSNEIKRSTDRFRTSYQEPMPMVKGNPQRIEQVCVNLIVNACQALPDKGRGIFLSTRYDADRAMNLIELRDQGTGIEAKNLPHLTDPFFTTRRQSGGTGLGLSVTARIVKEHGGQIEFASPPGEGTTVTVFLPPDHEGSAI